MILLHRALGSSAFLRQSIAAAAAAAAGSPLTHCNFIRSLPQGIPCSGVEADSRAVVVGCEAAGPAAAADVAPSTAAAVDVAPSTVAAAAAAADVAVSSAVTHAIASEESANSKTRTTKKRQMEYASLEYALQRNRKDTEFLLQTTIIRKRKKGRDVVSLWDYLQTYNTMGDNCSYDEKRQLLEPRTAEAIVAAVRERSERGTDTLFFEGDGGLSLVSTAVLREKLFRDVKVFERDENLLGLSRRALATPGGESPAGDAAAAAEPRGVSADAAAAPQLTAASKDIEQRIVDLNLVQIPAMWQLHHGEFLSPLYREAPYAPHLRWSSAADPPPYTLFATATHGLVKYLAQRCLERGRADSEFARGGRPEFFLIVSGRTWEHIGTGRRTNVAHNVLFRLLFDYELVRVLPRRAFVPWGRYHRHNVAANAADRLFLIWMRPKPDTGFDSRIAPETISYFVRQLFHSKTNRIVPLLETWLPGAGLNLVQNGGLNTYTTADEIELEQIVHILNSVAQHPNFLVSNLITEADEFEKTKFQNFQRCSLETENLYQILKRDFKKYGISGLKKRYEKYLLNDEHSTV